MKRVLDHIREHLLAGLEPPRMPDLDELRETEWSDEFEQLMRNRLLMGAFRYGELARASGEYDTLDSIRRRLDRFEETGNAELLVDVANLCLVTFARGLHPDFHFEAEDDGEHVEPIS